MVRNTYLPQRSTSGAPAEPADRVPDVVADHGGDEPDHADRDDVEPPDPAKTAPAMSTVSPGTGMPKSSTRTSSAIAHSP